MSKLNNGGPAFPQTSAMASSTLFKSAVAVNKSDGMTLRDYFAAKALAGSISKFEATDTVEKLAFACYKVADAMLAEREKEVAK